MIVNYALIFAGGTGQRMNSKARPKQFLELHGRPIIIHTVDVFEEHPQIDGILIVCLEEWIPFLEEKLDQFSIKKVIGIVPGGATGQESIANGVKAMSDQLEGGSVILIHDGVRPLIQPETISSCIESVISRGSAVTVVPATETVVQERNDEIINIIDRGQCKMAKAPQCFYLKDLDHACEQARKDGLNDFIDTASLMHHYGYDLYTVEGTFENIKITTPSDFYVFKAIVDARENSQIFGI